MLAYSDKQVETKDQVEVEFVLLEKKFEDFSVPRIEEAAEKWRFLRICWVW